MAAKTACQRQESRYRGKRNFVRTIANRFRSRAFLQARIGDRNFSRGNQATSYRWYSAPSLACTLSQNFSFRCLLLWLVGQRN